MELISTTLRTRILYITYHTIVFSSSNNHHQTTVAELSSPLCTHELLFSQSRRLNSAKSPHASLVAWVKISTKLSPISLHGARHPPFPLWPCLYNHYSHFPLHLTPLHHHHHHHAPLPSQKRVSPAIRSKSAVCLLHAKASDFLIVLVVSIAVLRELKEGGKLSVETVKNRHIKAIWKQP